MKFFFHLRLMIFISLSWIILFSFNKFIFEVFEFTSYANLIFIPAGLQLCFALIYKINAFLGLLDGALITGVLIGEPQINISNLIFISLIAASAPIISVYLSDLMLKYGQLLKDITFFKIIITSIIFASISTLLHNVYFIFQGLILQGQLFESIYIFFLGDIIGTLIFLTFIFNFQIPVKKFIAKYNLI